MNWKYIMLIGAILPLVTLLFVDNWRSHMGIIYNLQKAEVVIDPADPFHCEIQQRAHHTLKTTGKLPSCDNLLVGANLANALAKAHCKTNNEVVASTKRAGPTPR